MYRTLADMPEEEEEVKEPKKKRESPLVRLGLIPLIAAGPAASLGLTLGLMAQQTTALNVVLATGFVLWVLIAYLVGGLCVLDSDACSRIYRHWRARWRALAFAWSPFFFVAHGLLNVGRWVLYGSEEEDER